MAAAEGLAELLSLGAELLPAFVAVEDEEAADGDTGWLVDSADECAAACSEILAAPEDARPRALRGKEQVRRRFLTPRLLRDWLVLFNVLAGNDTAGSEIALV